MATYPLVEISLTKGDTPSNDTDGPRKRAKRTKAQIAAGQLHTASMWDEIQAMREHFKKSITNLAAQHSRWVLVTAAASTQHTYLLIQVA